VTALIPHLHDAGALGPEDPAIGGDSQFHRIFHRVLPFAIHFAVAIENHLAIRAIGLRPAGRG